MNAQNSIYNIFNQIHKEIQNSYPYFFYNETSMVCRIYSNVHIKITRT